MLLIIMGIVLFILLVVFHEYGHFIAAKKSGVEVEEFGLGFPPRITTLAKKNGTEYTLNWLPFGGFVKLKGETDDATAPGSFGAASLSKKTLIIAAGVLMNWLAAIIIFTVVALIGMPKLVDNQFTVKNDAKVVRQQVFAGEVEPHSPASMIGIKAFDRIVKVNDRVVTSKEELHDLTQKFANKKVTITFSRDGVVQTKQVLLRSDPKNGNLGVAPGEDTLIRYSWSAPIVGVGTTVQLTGMTFQGLASTVSNVFHGQGQKASENVIGPVGIVILLKNLARQGLVFVLFLIGIISLSLAVMNTLPIPALDGGRLFIILLFRVLNKPLTKDLEEKINGAGMLALLALITLITVIDIRHLF